MAKYIVTLLILFGCTYFAFDLIFTGHSELFFTDLAVTFIAECIFLSNVSVLTDETILDIKSAVGSFYLNLCAVILLVWMLVYNLAMKDDFALPIFIVGILVIIGGFVLIGSITTSTAEAALKKQEKLDAEIVNKRNYKSEINSYAFNTQKVLRAAEFAGKEELAKAYKIAVDKATAMPSFVLENKKTEAEHVILLLSEIQELCEKKDWKEENMSALASAIEELTFNIKSIK